MSELVGCPGTGQKPAIVRPEHAGRAVCPRCGGLLKVRADGRMRAHRVEPTSIVPAIRGAHYGSGVTRSRRT